MTYEPHRSPGASSGSHSTSSLPLPNRVQSGLTPSQSMRVEAEGGGGGDARSSMKEKEREELIAKRKKAEEEMNKAIRLSEYHAQLDEARRGSEADEDLRMLQIAMDESSHLESLQSAQVREREEAAFKKVMEESRLDKGKGRETDEQRREREEFELVLILSLTEGEARERERRAGGVQTTEQEFERLSLRTNNLDEARQRQAVDQEAARRDVETPTLSRSRSAFVITNPDEEPPPPAYDPLPVESTSIPEGDESTPIPEDDELNNNNNNLFKPTPPVLLSRMPSYSPSLERRESYSPETTFRNSNRRNSTMSALSIVARAGSFMSTHSSNISPPATPPLPLPPPSPPADTTSPETPIAPAAFYPPFLSAALGLEQGGISPSSTTISPTTPRHEIRVIQEDGGASEEGDRDPFDERFAAVDYSSVYHDHKDDHYRNGGASSPEMEARSPKTTSTGVYLPEVSYEPSLLSSRSRRGSAISEESSLYTSGGSDLDHLVLPEVGGIVDSTRSNASATTEVLEGVRFGFQAVQLAIRSLHPPLKLRGAFPDVVVLSKGLDVATGKPLFQSFAVEAKSWTALLQYLMWHGNSRIEPAPRDLLADIYNKGFSCNLTIEFFLSFEDGTTKVRCRLDLIDPILAASKKSKGDLPAVLDPEIPNISIDLAPIPIPIKLSTLANNLFVAHTQSRISQRRRSSLASPPPHTRALKNLPLAIDLFKTLNGEVVQSAAEVESDESKLLSRLKSKLKRRKRAPGIVKGGADGTGGHGSDIVRGGELPDGAMLVTPFRLDLEE